jgi:c-di-GMP-binding flagellar brake protein YcgR
MSHKENKDPEVPSWEMKRPPADMFIDLGLPKEISRQSFREPIAPEEEITARLSGQNFRVIDIGSRGIGISLSSRDELTQGQEFDITITLDEKLIRIRGKIVHISQEPEEGNYRCGIEFVDLAEETKKQLEEFIQKHHAELFGQSPGFL